MRHHFRRPQAMFDKGSLFYIHSEHVSQKGGLFNIHCWLFYAEQLQYYMAQRYPFYPRGDMDKKKVGTGKILGTDHVLK
jgi:hypothetical protein